jgi:hypothetical protein
VYGILHAKKSKSPKQETTTMSNNKIGLKVLRPEDDIRTWIDHQPFQLLTPNSRDLLQ